MASKSLKVFQVAVIIFEGADLLDYAGPVGLLSDVKYRSANLAGSQPAFKIRTMASNSPVRLGASETTVNPNLTLQEAHDKIDEFDILIIPGGPPGLVTQMATSDVPEVNFIKAFSTKTRNLGSEERIAFSVCDGSLFLGAVGALSGLCATSHHRTLDALKNFDGSIDIIDSTANGRVRRFVDGGVNEAGVRIVTAGGVTCGLDAALHVAELKVGRGPAEDCANMNEYEWKRA
ncbi:hypothetical protein MMC21_008179 [Puttea exsequens]|nr:hypothetical protein [Puttea exsequens]